jgi:hypothetical protein
MDTNSDRSIWNFDDERMKVLHEHMVICEFAFENWNLELVNKKLQTIALIVSGADWSENEWEAIEKSFEEIEELKREIDNSFSEQTVGEKQVAFYNKARDIYKTINRKMQSKGFFFRVREDEGL